MYLDFNATSKHIFSALSIPSNIINYTKTWGTQWSHVMCTFPPRILMSCILTYCQLFPVSTFNLGSLVCALVILNLNLSNSKSSLELTCKESENWWDLIKCYSSTWHPRWIVHQHVPKTWPNSIITKVFFVFWGATIKRNLFHARYIIGSWNFVA